MILAAMNRWNEQRHEGQWIPHDDWAIGIALAGRGWGKTRFGAEWSWQRAATYPGSIKKKYRHLVSAPTNGDLSGVCFDGDSGLLACIPPSLIRNYVKTPRPQVTLHNGAKIIGIAAEQPSRFRGPQFHSAWCLLPHHMVRMGDGTEKRLDTVRAGDYVLTRDGPRLVEWAGMTHPAAQVAEVTLSTGQSICGTLEHPVYTVEDGFVCLSHLTQRHHAMCLPTASGGSGAPMATTTAGCESARDPKTASAPSTFIVRSICARWGRSLRDTLSTIETKISQIMLQAIWRLCPAQSISRITPRGTFTAPITAPPLVGARKPDGTRSRHAPLPASTAEASFSPGTSGGRHASVAPGARISIGTARIQSVCTLTKKHAVYNLKVRGKPEFFANGILVHNCDEVAAWGDNGKDPQEAWDMINFGVRLGEDTRILVTTTPRPIPLIKDLIKRPDAVVFGGSTHQNMANLSPEFKKRVKMYEGTKIGRQEIYAEILEADDGIIRRSDLRLWPQGKPLPVFDLIIMSLDTAFSEESYDKKKRTTDPSACSVWGCFKHIPEKPRLDEKGRPRQEFGIMLLDCWAERLGFPELVDKVKHERKSMYGADDARPMISPLRGPSMPEGVGHGIDLIVIEEKASGKSLRQQLYKDGILTRPYNPGKADKLTRLHIVSPLPAHGVIWVPEGKSPGKPMSWATDLIDQLCTFSGEGSVLHDDLLDTTTQAWRVIDDTWLHYLREKAKRPLPGEDTIDTTANKPRVNPYAQ